MLDIGCGAGGMLKIGLDLGLYVLGVDGDYEVHLDVEDKYRVVHDYINGPSPVEGEFDLAWSVEFVEHVEEKYLDNFMKDFQKAKVVVFTHAVPGQDGHHHVNCQKDEYWVDIFTKYGFELDEFDTTQVRNISTMCGKNGGFMRASGLVFTTTAVATL